MKKIGLFGGSFNPVHIGHLNVAVELLERRGLDEIRFIPAKQSPFKKGQEPISIGHRVAMLQKAVEPHPQLLVDTIEAERAPPSYSVDTIRTFSEKAPDHDYYFIMGDDALEGFLQWKEPEVIVSLARLLIVTRQHVPVDLFKFKDHPAIEQAVRNGLTPVRAVDISSTEIRERIQKRLYCRHLLPEKNMDYIYENHLYYVD